MQDPTPSQRTNELIHLLQEVAEGRRMAADVEPLFHARVAELDETRESFRKGIQEGNLPEEAARPAHRVDEAFGAYRDAIAEALRALELPSPEALEPPAHTLAAAGTDLWQAMRDYEVSFVTSGNTRFPLLNLLRRLRDTLALPAGADLSVVATWSRPLLQQTADSMRRDPRLETLTAAFDRAAAALAAGPEHALAEVQRACTEVETALLGELAPPAPPSSWLEAVLASARGHARGDVPAELVLEAVDALELRLVLAYQGFEEAAAGAGTSGPLLQEELDRARDRFAILNEALEGVRQALEGAGDPEPWLRTLEGAGEGLLESQRFFEEADGRQGHAACPRCGHLNAVGSRVCSSCAAQLPRLGAAPEATELPESGTVRSQHLLELMQAAEKAATGEISPEQFAGYLRWGYDLVLRGQESMAALPPEDLQDEESRSLAERTREGLQEFQTGLEELSTWAGGGGQDYYRAGTRHLLRGGQKLEAVREETRT